MPAAIGKSYGVLSASDYKTGYANRTTYSVTIDSISTTWPSPTITFRVLAGQSDRLKIEQFTGSSSFFYYDYNISTGVSSSIVVSMGQGSANFPAAWDIVLYNPVVIANTPAGEQQVYFDWEIVLNGTVQIESLTDSTRNHNPALFRLGSFCKDQELGVGAEADSFKLYVSKIQINTNNDCP